MPATCGALRNGVHVRVVVPGSQPLRCSRRGDLIDPLHVAAPWWIAELNPD